MSDPTTPGDTTAAPAGTPAGTHAATPSFGTFGEKRGSGLARGKRPAVTTAPAAGSAASGYQPSTIAVLKAKSEYVNPFTGETSAPAAAINEPTPAAAPERTVVPPTPAPAAVEIARENPAPMPAPAPAAPAARERTQPEKAQLNILPPEETRRAAQSWDSPSARRDPAPPRQETRDRTDPRPMFRPGQPDEPRRENRRPEPSVKLPPSAPEPPLPVAEAGGFFSWLKSLFGGGKKSSHRSSSHSGSSHSSSTPTADAPRHEGGERRRRRRGGRGRNQRREGGESSGGHRHHQHSDGGHRHHREGGERRRHDGGHQGGGDGQSGPTAS